ncbi:cohesin domain-containing protein [Patescibacteria group bacterium]
MKRGLGRYFDKAERRFRRSQRGVKSSAWPEYLTSTQPKVRRIIERTRRRATVEEKIKTNVEDLYQDVTAQNIASTQISKSQRGQIPQRVNMKKALAWGSWGIGMAIFLGSLLLNAPFPIGALILESLPGEDRVGSFVLTTENEQLRHGETFTVDVAIGEVEDFGIQGAAVEIIFDDKALDFRGVNTEGSIFSKVVSTEYDQERGMAKIVLEEKTKDVTTGSQIATLEFWGKPYVGPTKIQIMEESYVYLSQEEITLPEDRGELRINFVPQELPSQEIAIDAKVDPVIVDGKFDDWRDVINYNLASFEPAGVTLAEKNLVEGQITLSGDAGGNMQIAQNGEFIYVSYFGLDDELQTRDAIAIKIGEKIFEVVIQDALTQNYIVEGMDAKAEQTDAGFNIEVALNRASAQIESGRMNFNFEVQDQDSQDGARLLLSFPDDSIINL